MTSTQKHRLATMVIFIILSAIFAFFIFHSARTREANRREDAGYIAEIKLAEIKNGVNGALSHARIFGEFVEYESTLDESTFIELAQSFYHSSDSVQQFLYAPRGVVEATFPILSINDNVNLFEDKRFAKAAQYSREHNLATLVGPVDFYGASDGYVILQPIYRSDSGSDAMFWGFIVVRIDMDEILDGAKFEELTEQGYDYEFIREKNDYASQNRIVYSKKTIMDSVTATATLTNQEEYSLSLTPITGWSDSGTMIQYILLGMLLSCMISLMLYNMLQNLWMSNHDMLTSLLNMRSYYRKLHSLQRRRATYGIIYLDLNGFKQINDTYGHSAGDRLLVVTAKRMTEAMKRPADGDLERVAEYGVADKTRYRGVFGHVYRLGGDEFSMILPGNYTDEEFERIMKRVLRNVNQLVAIGNNRIAVSTSIGYAKTRDEVRDYTEIIKEADEMMYANKQAYKKEHPNGR